MAKIKGYWKWHKDESTGDWISGDFRWNCSFESNGQTFTEIETYYNTGVQCIRYIGEETNKFVRSFASRGDEIVATWDTKYLVMNFGATWQDIDDELYSFITNHADSWGMSDRLITIYDNEQKVYDKGYQVGEEAGDAAGYDRGYSAGEQDGYSAGELKGYNDGKTEGRAEGKAEGLKEGYDNGYQDGLVSGEAYEKGKQAEYDAFWDAIQENGKRTEYAYAFARWASEYIRPKHKVVLTVAGSQKNIFYMNKYVKKIEAAYFDFSQLPRGTNDNQAFSYCFTSSTALEEIEDIGLPISYSYAYAFAWCSKLRKIAMIRVDETTQGMGSAFTSCIALESVAFEGVIGISINLQWSTKLTRASIENIINHLSDNGSGKTLTLSKAAVDEAFRGISAGDFTTIVPGSSSLDWFNLTHGATVYKQWTITLV